MSADARGLRTLVYIFPGVIWAWDCPVAKGTQLLKGDTAFLGTQLAGLIPALAGPLATTAPGLGGVESFGY